jgi:hypothetical protein
MKYAMGKSVLAAVFAIGLVVVLAGASYADDGGCSLARSAGKYSFTDTGTIVGVGQRAAVGVFTLDGAGNLIDGSATSSLNGSIAVETFNGTYTVNSDCTLTLKGKIYASGVEIFAVTLNGAFDDHMKELRAVFASVTLPNAAALPSVIALDARRQ